jgi:hypothetical protein
VSDSPRGVAAVVKDDLPRLARAVEANTAVLREVRAALARVEADSVATRGRVDRLSLLVEGVRGVVVLPAPEGGS